MAEALQQELEKLNALLAAEGVTPYRLGIADPKIMVPAPINAHFMSKRTYDQLVANIQKDGNLGSLPFCWHEVRPEGLVINILSGHHRVEAAIDAGVKMILYLYTSTELSQEERTAIQLSHNAIHGEDDMNILRLQWQSIDSLQVKLYTGLDDEFFKSFEPVVLGAFNEKDITFQTIELLFLPSESDRLTEIMQKIKGSKRLRYANLDQQYDDFAETIMRLKEAAQVFNSSTAFLVMVEATNLYCEFLESLETLEPEHWAALQEQLAEKGLLNGSGVKERK